MVSMATGTMMTHSLLSHPLPTGPSALAAAGGGGTQQPPPCAGTRVRMGCVDARDRKHLCTHVHVHTCTLVHVHARVRTPVHLNVPPTPPLEVGEGGGVTSSVSQLRGDAAAFLISLLKEDYF